jgi:Ca2+-binding RTX toxin-like protein
VAIVRKKNGEFYASSTNSGGQTEPRVAALAAGGYVVVWESDTGADIRAQRFDSSGAMVGGEIVVADSGLVESEPEIVALATGNFLVVWRIRNAGEDSLVGQMYAADGTPLGTRFSVAPPLTETPDHYQSEAGAFALPGGGFVLAWQGDDVLAQIYDSAGAKVGGQILVHTDKGQFQPLGAAIGEGRFVIAWRERMPDSSLQHKFQLFESDGDKVGGAIALPGATNPNPPAIAALAGGGFVAVWDKGYGGTIAAQRYDVNGAAVGAEISVTVPTYPLHSELPGVLALPWGGFLVSYNHADNGNRSIGARLYDSDGNALGGPFQISSEALNFELFSFSSRARLALLDSGEVVAVWSSEAGTNAAQAGIKAQHLLMPMLGTPGSDLLNLTGDDDSIAALGGNDIVSAGAGSDVVDGGAGDDFLSGGAGADTLYGGEGIDTANYSATGESAPVAVNLHWNASLVSHGHPAGVRALGPGEALDGSGSVDRLFGVENLVLTAGDDRAYGSDGANRIDAGAGNDTVTAFGGDDLVFGQAGRDVVLGGLGNDMLDGGDDGDDLRGEAGHDTLEGGAGNDILYGDANPYGGDGNDVLRGGDGNDFMQGGNGVDSFDGGANDELTNPTTLYGDRVGFAEQRATQGAVADLRTGIISNDGFGNAETMANVESLGPGTAFIDTFYGNDGRNALDGAIGDNLYGLGGDDVVILRAVPGTAEGGSGHDTLQLLSNGGWYLPDFDEDGALDIAPAMTTGWEVDLESGSIADGYGIHGTVQGFESIVGSGRDDRLSGSSQSNSLAGGTGADHLSGAGGDDTLDGGAGNDVLQGGSGVDSFDGGADGGAVSGGSIGHGDRISFFEPLATQGVVADLRTGTISNDGFGNAETMSGIESLGADTAFADSLYGNDSPNALFGGLGDSLHGFGGDDGFELSAAAALVDGGDGADRLHLRSNAPAYRPDSNGDGSAELAPAMTEGWNVDLAAGTLRDGFGNAGTVAGIENLTGSHLGDELRGSSAANRIDGASGNDFLLLHDGGDDTGLGGEGNDVLYYGSALSSGDVADGGDGRDALVLQGNVTAVLTNTNLVGIESISIQSGANTRFGDTANNFYDFDITTADGNVASGQQLIVNAQSLRPGEDFTFDGSAESDGKFLVYGGHGVDDLTGGAGADVFLFEGQRWGANDKVDGGAGRDALVISAGSGLTHIAFAADALTGIESISLNNRYATDPSQKPSYELVLHNGNVAAGGTLIVNGSSIPAGQLVNIDGRGVHDGNLILFGGGGHDTLFGGDGNDLILGGGGADGLTGGAGADTFRYDAASDSTSGLYDLIGDFQTGVDKIDLSRIDANTHAAGDQAFSWIGSNAFSGTGAASAGELRVFDDNGYQRIEGDTNGDGVADLVIVLQVGTAPVVQGDFLP